jgi:hypothetical protein
MGISIAGVGVVATMGSVTGFQLAGRILSVRSMT